MRRVGALRRKIVRVTLRQSRPRGATSGKGRVVGGGESMASPREASKRPEGFRCAFSSVSSTGAGIAAFRRSSVSPSVGKQGWRRRNRSTSMRRWRNGWPRSFRHCGPFRRKLFDRSAYQCRPEPVNLPAGPPEAGFGTRRIPVVELPCLTPRWHPNGETHEADIDAQARRLRGCEPVDQRGRRRDAVIANW